MYVTNKVLEKLNTERKNRQLPELSLSDIMLSSLPEVNTLAKSSLSWGEQNFIWQQAQEQLKQNKFTESRIFGRANPQLTHAVRLGIRHAAQQRSYDDLFGGRASKFVKPGSVASIFSPAGYLTELYREARNLHPARSGYRLDQRRPDLAALPLSQSNMDDELSTLSLCNQLLLNNIIQAKAAKDYDGVMALLASWRFSGSTPFDQTYESARRAILLQDAEFAAFAGNPAVAERTDGTMLLRMKADISPELYKILTEVIEGINDTDAAKLYSANFGSTAIAAFQNPGMLARYYRLSNDALMPYFEIMKSLDTAFEPTKITTIQLLKLNKIIRLGNTTGMSAADIRTVIESNNKKLEINAEVLGRLFWAQYYRQRYGIDLSAALVLAGAPISQISHDNQPSHFDRLFNTPLLDNQRFATGTTTVDLNPAASAPDTFITGVLKRAFKVNDSALYALWLLARGGGNSTNFSASIDNLSALYRVRLLAEVHSLSIPELGALLAISSYASLTFINPTAVQLVAVMNFLDLYTRWLQSQQLSVADLFLMTTTSYGTLMTPEIENLIATLKNGLSGQKYDNTTQYGVAAPFIAAAMQLDSAETASAVLQWLDQTLPGQMTVALFLQLVLKDTPNEDDNKKLVQYGTMLAQLALIARALRLSAAELALAVNKPGMFVKNAVVLAHDIATVLTLARFHRWLQQSPELAAELLTALTATELTPAQLAQAMGLEENIVAQGLQLASGGSASKFNGWIDVDATLQWVDVATRLGITPAGVDALIKLIKADSQTYPAWRAVSRTLQAGLNGQQTAQLHAEIDEATSHALSAYAISNSTPDWVNGRDDLYSYLLIDNEVSAAVKTTRLAEAIASVQLYVNRALSGQESGVDTGVQARAFFTDWDNYNKRYSTWAGLSQLVYYPENYVDPTLRRGQTGMIDEMLQSISQSQLTSETVDDAFKTYMTRFEEIADLEVVSGYHDDNHLNSGTSWLVGKSATEEAYYWRTLDQNKFSGGKYPANAWSEWQEIKTGTRPVNQLIRPVVFNSRLYIVWLEEKETAKQSTDSEDNTTVTKINSYELNYTFIRHDGSWNNVTRIPLANFFAEGVLASFASKRFYCSRSATSGAMIVLFYTPGVDEEANRVTAAVGLTIDSYHNVAIIDAPNGFRDYAWRQFDTQSTRKVNQLYLVDFSVPMKTTSMYYTWGDKWLTILKDGGAYNCSFVSSDDTSVTIAFNCDLNVTYIGYGAGTVSRYNVTSMKQFGNMGDTFGYYYTLTIDPLFNTTGRFMYPLYWPAQSSNGSKAKILLYRETGATGLRVWMPAVGATAIASSEDTANSLALDTTATDAQFMANSLRTLDDAFSATIASEMTKIKTGIDAKKVTVKISAGGQSKIYNANDAIGSSALPVQNFASTIYSFKNLEFTIPLAAFVDGKAEVNFTLTAYSDDDRFLGDQTGSIFVSRNTDAAPMLIVRGSAGEQYLENGPWRTRVNTLFARQLVARANMGLDTVLSMETQQLQEPQLGAGNYLVVNFGRYNQASHGDGSYELYYLGALTNGANNLRSKHIAAAGQLASDQDTSVTLFLPYNAAKTGAEAANLYLGVKYSDADLTSGDNNLQIFTYDTSNKVFKADSGNGTKTRGLSTRLSVDTTTEAMDFSGANALYFWEMFYYAPMMIFQRLLQEQRFAEATRWIKYIWSPEGYRVNGEPAAYQWNVRPLEEDTAWNASPLDSVDPDAVAQADPMHYKVATFMRTLDLLIARGDAAYRQLERDALNEAKMWYVQALDILGVEPWLALAGGWSDPKLSDAADSTTQANAQQALLVIRQQADKKTLRTGNSLTNLFFPQQNEKLHGYWQTLALRLYNLRHNLSIDGQPLSLPIYAAPRDPSALLSSAVSASQAGAALPEAVMPLQRFPLMVERARALVSQLSLFGSNLLTLTERQDAEALAELLQTQGAELVRQSIALQERNIAEIDADRVALQESRNGAQSRLDSYSALYEENVNRAEKQAMDLYLSASVLSTTATGFYTTAAGLDAVPNVFGVAFGGSRYGSIARAVGTGIEISASASRTAADRISQSEIYRRRRQEWEIQRNAAASEVKQIDAQLASLAVRREAAVRQKSYQETQQIQTQAQLSFLQNKFSNRALYNWLRGKLAAIYYQFYDLAVSRCLMAQQSYRWALGDSAASFIRPGAWLGSYAGLLAGETLMLNLTQMEQRYLEKEEREKEVTRTVCLSAVYSNLGGNDSFTLTEKIKELIADNSKKFGKNNNQLSMSSDHQLLAALSLADLKIGDDYPAELGNTRRIKQISVTLPALVGPYQDVCAVLSYSGLTLPRGCSSQAVSHGMNDSGQFQLDFNDARWLPFEGIPLNDTGTLTLSFPQATTDQKDLLLSLSDIILHIRYTIFNFSAT
ncbi:neuraminidase-like domain-containing protein [Pantoea sp. B65]|uniref:Tc toxin subunit A-related protein n=1 Tax=Pantoea sp. B65 TaxID=2813359 RepID=UPI0039B59042